MYIADLDRPWLETPFPLQGFYVFSQEDMDLVAGHCSYVYVDTRRFSKEAAADRESVAPRRVYRNKTTLKEELQSAKPCLASSGESMARVFASLRKGGHLDVDVVKSAIHPLIESVFRNNEAIAALMRMKKKGEYLYNHSLAVTVWAAVLGRQLGIERRRLERLALGAALLDIGMASLDDGLTQVTGPLDESGLERMRKHVPLGVDLLKLNRDLPEDVVEMVTTHHERHDGSGYPHGLSGNDIPLFGRIAGLVDSYDAMITPRPWAPSRSSFQAMQELSDLRDKLFQGALVEQLMQAIGLFPTGSLVQLNTGEIAVVVQQNAARRLRPKVVVVLDADGRRKSTLVVLDLLSYRADSSAQSDLWITQELEPGAHGIEPDEFFL